MIEAPVLHVNGDDPEAVVLCTPARARLPPGVQQGRRRRHRLLPQARPQRAGHAGADAAADVQEDRAAPGHAQALRRQAGRAGRAAGRRPGRDGQGDFAPRWTPARARYDPVLTNYKSKYAVDWAPFLGKKWTDAADTALPLAEIKRLAERITTVPPNFKVASAGREGARRPRRDGPRRDQRRLGHGRAPRVRVAGRERLRGAPVGRGLRRAARSRTATRCCTTRTARSGTKAPTRRCSTSPTARRRSSSSTRCCPKRRCSASSTATRAPSRTRW